MYKINDTNSFLDDYEIVLENKKFKHKAFEKIIDLLANGNFLELSQIPYRAHKLKGEYIGHYDVHVQNDIVLIYTIDRDNKTIDLVRIGTHARLFK